MGIGNRLRETLYFLLFALRGYPIGSTYQQFHSQYRKGIPPDLLKNRLIKLLDHARNHVPYYAAIIGKMGDGFHENPFAYLKNFPILTRDTLRNQFDRLTSDDVSHRKYKLNHSGGSTGEPVHFLQDSGFYTTSRAISLLYSKIIGIEPGEPKIFLWGSERDILQGTEKWTAALVTRLTNASFINAYRMSPSTLYAFSRLIHQKRPSLIMAYAESIYEAANFFEKNNLPVYPPRAIFTSAGTLFPAMREKIRQVFQCEVYNYYGSRECGAIACELPGMQGLWVAPWGNYLEVIDENGNALPPQSRGEILITSLSNYVMPLIRYRIGDIGALDETADHTSQILLTLSGRINQHFKLRDNTLIDPGFFEYLLYAKPWIRKFQVAQKDYSTLVFRFITTDTLRHEDDLAEIRQNTRALMGEDCQITFEFVDELPPTPSGKFLYMYSEVHNAE